MAHTQKVLHKEKLADIEYSIFQDIRKYASSQADNLRQLAKLIAEIDTIAAFANISIKNNYSRPKIRPGASPEAVPVHDHRLEQIRHHPGHHRAHINARQAHILDARDRQHQIHQPLEQGQILVLLEDPRRDLEIDQNDPAALKIQIDQDQRQHRLTQRPAVVQPQPRDKRR